MELHGLSHDSTPGEIASHMLFQIELIADVSRDLDGERWGDAAPKIDSQSIECLYLDTFISMSRISDDLFRENSIQQCFELLGGKVEARLAAMRNAFMECLKLEEHPPIQARLESFEKQIANLESALNGNPTLYEDTLVSHVHRIPRYFGLVTESVVGKEAKKSQVLQDYTIL